mgnify:CR=1 FL=1|tara:strand:- start:158 stop:856 length:699 start_codon:yes stop_codon:yes gene_type:complete
MQQINQNLRYERKFILNNNMINNIFDLRSYLSINIENHYDQRRVNSIYYDTYNFCLSEIAKNGISERKKIRIRYYGELDNLLYPKLEIKYKYGLMGRKKTYDVPFDFLNENKFSIVSFNQINNSHDININLIKTSEPKLIISYKRNYFLSCCKRFRFTLDSEIIFKTFDKDNLKQNFNKNLYYHYNKRILEIKYAYSHESDAHKLTQKLPVRITSSSKYLIALSYLGLVPLY